MMQKIIITRPAFFPDENCQIRQLLSDKALRLHVRKPDASLQEYEALLQAIPAKLHPRVVLHDFYFLLEKYNIGGIHFSAKKRSVMSSEAETSQKPDNDEMVSLLRCLDKLDMTKSTSCHSIAELQALDGQFDYTFLSPIFPSISKQGYAGNLDMNAVAAFLQQPRKTKVIALGGIDESRTPQIEAWGFDGYAMLGAAWKLPFPLEEMGGRLQYITQDNAQLTHAEQARLMYENGVRWVQIRMKNAPREAIVAQAKEALQHARRLGGTLIVNDHVDICREIGAHGVHVGLTDTSVAEARRMLGGGCIIGGTANTADDVELHACNGADYVGLGPFRFTTTKQNISPIIGIEGYRQIVGEMQRRQLATPIVAVGGIEQEDMQTLRDAGLFGVAVSSSLLKKYIQKWKI